MGGVRARCETWGFGHTSLHRVIDAHAKYQPSAESRRLGIHAQSQRVGAKMAAEAQARAARPWRVPPGPGRACAWASNQGRLRSTRPGGGERAELRKIPAGAIVFLLAAVRNSLRY